MSGVAVFVVVCAVLALPWLHALWQWCRLPRSSASRREQNDG